MKTLSLGNRPSADGAAVLEPALGPPPARPSRHAGHPPHPRPHAPRHSQQGKVQSWMSFMVRNLPRINNFWVLLYTYAEMGYNCFKSFT